MRRSSPLLLVVLSLTPLQARAATAVLELGGLDPFDRWLSRYQVLSLVPPDLAADVRVEDDRLTVPCDVVGSLPCRTFTDTLAPDGSLDPGRLEQVWQPAFHATRQQRGDATLIPDDVASFARVTGYQGFATTVLDRSMIKRLRRVLYRGDVRGRALSVAETYAADGTVREVEVAIASRLDPGSFHFYVYGPDGRLAPESEFPAGLRPAPKICAACHLNQTTGRVDRFLGP